MVPPIWLTTDWSIWAPCSHSGKPATSEKVMWKPLPPG